MKKPKIFIQQCGSYTNEVLVICGASKNETFLFLKKVRAIKAFAKWVLEDYDEWHEKLKKNTSGMFCYNDKVMGYVMVLRPHKDNWNYWETLMHEVHHLVLHTAKMKGFLEEPENNAYLFDFLFRNLRRKLQGTDPI